jgi:tetratricopeptide (TPR) repeat protein
LRWGVLLAAAATIGCASRRPASIADRFVKQGEPTIDLGGQPPAPSTAEYVAKLRALAAQARPHAKSVSPEVAEARDQRLRDRLAALRAAPSAAAHRDVAAEYRRLGIADAAYSHLSAAIRLAPKDAVAYDQRARIWRAWLLPALGLPDARRAVALAPASATAWNTLGLLLEDSGHTTDGIEAYLRAVVLDAGAGYAWSNLCRAWSTTGDSASAAQACRHVLAIDPSDRSAQLNLLKAERLAAPRQRRPDEINAASGERPAPPEAAGVTRTLRTLHQ